MTAKGSSGWTGSGEAREWVRHAETACTNGVDPDTGLEIPWSVLEQFAPIDVRAEVESGIMTEDRYTLLTLPCSLRLPVAATVCFCSWTVCALCGTHRFKLRSVSMPLLSIQVDMDSECAVLTVAAELHAW